MKDTKGHGSDAHTDSIEQAVPRTAYAFALSRRDALGAIVEQHSATLKQFPSGPNGLTPDHVRATPEYKTAKSNFDRAFAALRTSNAYLMKNFKTEMKADRDARRKNR